MYSGGEESWGYLRMSTTIQAFPSLSILPHMAPGKCLSKALSPVLSSLISVAYRVLGVLVQPLPAPPTTPCADSSEALFTPQTQWALSGSAMLPPVLRASCPFSRVSCSFPCLPWVPEHGCLHHPGDRVIRCACFPASFGCQLIPSSSTYVPCRGQGLACQAA